MKKEKIGKIDISALNTPPEKHEYETAKYFAARGFDVVFMKPSNIKGTNSPDFAMKGKVWETKSPNGNSKRTFEDNFRKAIKQSPNIIFDLRRLKPQAENMCLKMLQRQSKNKDVKILMVVTRDGRVFTIKGKFDIM